MTTRRLSQAEVMFALDAVLDALRELEEEPLASAVSQGVVDKLTSTQEILTNAPEV